MKLTSTIRQRLSQRLSLRQGRQESTSSSSKLTSTTTITRLFQFHCTMDTSSEEIPTPPLPATTNIEEEEEEVTNDNEDDNVEVEIRRQQPHRSAKKKLVHGELSEQLQENYFEDTSGDESDEDDDDLELDISTSASSRNSGMKKRSHRRSIQESDEEEEQEWKDPGEDDDDLELEKEGEEDEDNDDSSDDDSSDDDIAFSRKILDFDALEEQQDDNDDDENNNTNFDIKLSLVYKEWMKLTFGECVRYNEMIFERDYPRDTDRLITAIEDKHREQNPEVTVNYIAPDENEWKSQQQIYDDRHKEEFEQWLLLKERFSRNTNTNSIEYDCTQTRHWRTWEALPIDAEYRFDECRLLKKGNSDDEDLLKHSIRRKIYNSYVTTYKKINPKLIARTRTDTSLWSVEERKLYKLLKSKNYVPTKITDTVIGYKALSTLYQNGMIGEFFRKFDEKFNIVEELSNKNIHLKKEVPYFSDRVSHGRSGLVGQVCPARDNYYYFHLMVEKRVRFPNGETLTESYIQTRIRLHCAIMFRSVYERHKNTQELTVAERCWFDLIIKCVNFNDANFLWEVSHLDHDPNNIALNNLIVETALRNKERQKHRSQYGLCTKCNSISRFLACECVPPCKKLAQIICEGCDDTRIPDVLRDALRRAITSSSSS